MSAFLKLDRCQICSKDLPWEWVPQVVVTGRPLAGTGVWRSALRGGVCPHCADQEGMRRSRAEQLRSRSKALVRIVGGPQPVRDFTFSRFTITNGNRLAFDAARRFDSESDNLCLWGPDGAGKTHLAMAALRRAFMHGRSATVLTPLQLLRRVSTYASHAEQEPIKAVVAIDCLVLDDIDAANAQTRPLLREVLDARLYADRRGLIVTSRRAPSSMAFRIEHESIASRLARMCRAIEVAPVAGRVESRRA